MRIETIDALALTSDDRFLISGSWDKSIKVWDSHTFKNVKTFEKAHDGTRKFIFLIFRCYKWNSYH
jgi:WD domain, G-beta repeat.